MKVLKILSILLIASICFYSCGDDDDDNNNSGLDFIDQSLQGMINGNNWQASSGLAEPSPFEDNELSIEISGSIIDDICNEFILEGLRVFFSVPNRVGEYQLDFGSQSITLFDPAETLNIIVVNGAVEIQSINATDGGTVTGRIVGESDNENFINGNFTVIYCAE